MEQDVAERVALPGPDKGGAWVRMGDKQYKVAPLNFKALRELADSVAVLKSVEPGAMPTGQQMAVLVQLAHASLKRNYPDITEDDVADNLDFSNFAAVLGAVMGASALTGLEVPKQGETNPG